MARLTDGQGRHAVYAFVNEAIPGIDVYKQKRAKTGTIVTTPDGMFLNDPRVAADMHVPLSFDTWLPFAAPVYHISSDPEDFVITPVIVMPSDLPNRNAVAFPKRELVKFSSEMGMQAYKTWAGKPTYYEHANDDVTKAYGVIIDSYMHKLETHGNGNIWKLLLLLAFDRNKHPDIAEDILQGRLNTYSMGSWVTSYTCSLCEAEVGKCEHLDPEAEAQMYIRDGILVFKNVKDICGFECSAVGDPAFTTAISDHKFTL